MAETSNNTAKWALVISFISMSISGLTYWSSLTKDWREAEAKRPTIDIIPTAKTSREWNLAVMVANKSDQRIKVVGFAIPAPKGGFVKLQQMHPPGQYASGASMNSEHGNTTDGRPVNPGDGAMYTGEYSISDAYPAPHDVSLTMQATIRYLGSSEREETISVTRRLN